MREKDQQISQLVSKYINPRETKQFFYTMKKPHTLPIKEEDRVKHGLEDKELTMKDIVRLQDEARRKAIAKYYRWKFSIFNENNVLSPRGSVVMKYDAEF